MSQSLELQILDNLETKELFPISNEEIDPYFYYYMIDWIKKWKLWKYQSI